MASLNSLNNIAVLIDADNASAKNIGWILKEINKLGHITCKKIYGDWSSAHIQGWQEALRTHVIEPMQHFAYVKGKNATDIGIVIEAMDLLYSGTYDGFCLISSDSDFTSLALRIRKNGVKVFGFGKHNTVEAFAQSCDEFYYVEDLLPTEKSASPTNTKPQEVIKAINIPDPALVKVWDKNRLKCDSKLLNSLRASIIDHPKADAQRWLNLGLVGLDIKKHYPEFDPKNYGYDRLAGIIKNIDLFEIKEVETSLYVREKSAKKVAKSFTSSTNKAPARFTTQQLQTQTQLINVLNKLIKADPNADEGWSNISYLASQIKQHYANIQLAKYGYKKFSDLITAIDLYDVRRRNKVIAIKLKTQKSKPV